MRFRFKSKTYLGALNELYPGKKGKRYAIAYREHIVQRSVQLIDLIESKTPLANCNVIDIGCGAGGTLPVLSEKGAFPCGVECDTTTTLIGKILQDENNSKGIIIQGDAQQLPFTDTVFDVAICNDMLEHTPDWRTCLSDMFRVLKPKGFFYISFQPKYSVLNFFSDPHYRMLAVSLLSKKWGKKYVVDFRKKSQSYGVFTLVPTGALLKFLKRFSNDFTVETPRTFLSSFSDCGNRNNYSRFGKVKKCLKALHLIPFIEKIARNRFYARHIHTTLEFVGTKRA